LPSRRRVGSNIHGDGQKAKQNMGVSCDSACAEEKGPISLEDPTYPTCHLFLWC
jgi:hypothetical protein